MRFSGLAGAVLVLAAACGGGSPTGTATPTGGPSIAGATPVSGCTGGPGLPVAIADFSFGPQSITVAVDGPVTWANAGATAHTVTFDNGPDCGRLAPAATVSRTFDTAGTFTYKCTIHPAMRGTVVVQ